MEQIIKTKRLREALVFLLFISIVVPFVSCSNHVNLSRLEQLTKEALKEGSAESALLYSSRAIEQAETEAERSSAYALHGFANYIHSDYSKAFEAFRTSNTHERNEDASAGIILGAFGKKDYAYVIDHRSLVETLSGEWRFILGGTSLNQTVLFETVSLSACIKGNRGVYDDIKQHLDNNTREKMEAFFFD